MPRRLLPLAAVALALSLVGGCADDVSPAATIGDRTITSDQLFAEVDEWASSPTLLDALETGSVEGAGSGTYATAFVDFVLSNRIRFELHNEEFLTQGLTLTPDDIEAVRAGLLDDPATTETALAELSPEYRDQLLSDVARQFAVSQALAEGYAQWRTEAFAAAIAIDPRFGSWDPTGGSVVPPSGPRPAPTPAFAGP